jgi:hypothetical protein
MPYITSMASFREWLIRESGDIFGIQRKIKSHGKGKNPEPDGPVIDIHSDVIVEFMMRQKMNGVEPISEFCNQIRWGENTGAMQMVISPLGSYKSIIRRLQPDLKGNNVWACKKILPYKEILDASVRLDEKLASGILSEIERIGKGTVEAPSHDYDGLERLVTRLSRAVRRKGVIPEIFVYRGVRRVKEDEHYIVAFELAGQGVEAPGSARVEQFHIEMAYDPSTGMIRIFGHDVQSPTKGHVWYPMPSEWDERFSSGQGDHEIIDCITAALSTY